MKKLLQFIACELGLHAWSGDCENIDVPYKGDTLTIGWCNCKRCSATRLNFIYRSRA